MGEAVEKEAFKKDNGNGGHTGVNYVAHMLAIVFA